MTVIELRKYGVEAHGHSQSPRVNDCDLVCCAVSTLVCTLSYSVQKWWDEGKLQELPEIHTQTGSALISFMPKEEFENELNIAFDVIRLGLKTLSLQYSEYLCIC